MDPLKIGNVVRVANGKVEIVITIDDLNVVHEDRTYRVGQLGSYITIPMDTRTLIAFVTSFGRQEVTMADIEPQLIIEAQLLGEIQDNSFKRGVTEYPIVGDDVWVAVESDFEAIFGSFDQLVQGSKHPQSFVLGQFALEREFDVKVLGSEMFSKHVSVLGNSGSGKSCTTSKILQEVLDLSSSQVIMFDMHGEYRAAFSDDEGQLNANVTYLGADDLVVPYWLLKYEELEELLVDRSDPRTLSTQISFLRTAMLEYKQDAAHRLGLQKTLTLDTPIYFDLEKFKTYAENLNDARYVLNDDHLAFSQLALRSLMPEEQMELMRNQRCQFNRGNPEGETPHPMFFGKLLGLIDQIDTKWQDRRYEFMFRPIEHGLKSKYFKDHLENAHTSDATSRLMNHLIKLLTGRVQPRCNLTIIDLSGIPFEIVDITVAVLTRLIFDLNFWTPASTRHPTLLVFEEAHNYIPRTLGQGKQFARRAVERVAKEGRKYGVSAMIVSQRPSEISETVLAQCNSFVVMRLSNPEDQHYVSRVVGDHFAGVINMLPNLRPGEAFVIGDSVIMPMRTLVEFPNPAPQSGTVDFFKLWAQEEINDDIDEIISHWCRQDRQKLDEVPEEDRIDPFAVPEVPHDDNPHGVYKPIPGIPEALQPSSSVPAPKEPGTNEEKTPAPPRPVSKFLDFSKRPGA